MNKTIAIITSGHPPFDERIFHKFASSFYNNGFDVVIICSTQEINELRNGIRIIGMEGNALSKRAKLNYFKACLDDVKPDVIICCEPLPIIAAYRYKKSSAKQIKIISDITEWYPENVAHKYPGIKKILNHIVLFAFNIYCSNLADALIIGEETKKGRYDLIAPFKEKIIISYYPVLKYFNYSPPPFNGKVFTMCYAGLINFDRGILKLLDAAIILSRKYSNITFRLKVIGKFQNKNEEQIFNERIKNLKELEIIRIGWVDYTEISNHLEDVDVCLDLRTLNFIYRNSLPIKIFEYMACGKPFIFSDVRPIRKEMDADNFGFLVNPDDMDEITSAISRYIKSRELLLQHSHYARRAVEETYCWENIEEDLITFCKGIMNSLGVISNK